MVLVVLVCVSLVVLLCPHGGLGITCTIDKKDSCQCTFPLNGTTWHINLRDYYTYPVEPTTSDKYTYSYICYNSPCPKNDKVSAVACQYDPNQKVDIPLGVVNSDTTWEVTDTSDDKFAFTITYKGGQEKRQTQVNFQHITGEMAMKVESSKSSKYTLVATGSKIQKFRPSGSGGKAIIAGPIGIVIILLAIIGFVTYCIVGGIYMYKVKGARGREVVPQYSFWRGLPLLIKDGFFFTISPCYKRTDYESL